MCSFSHASASLTLPYVASWVRFTQGVKTIDGAREVLIPSRTWTLSSAFATCKFQHQIPFYWWDVTMSCKWAVVYLKHGQADIVWYNMNWCFVTNIKKDSHLLWSGRWQLQNKPVKWPLGFPWRQMHGNRQNKAPLCAFKRTYWVQYFFIGNIFSNCNGSQWLPIKCL